MSAETRTAETEPAPEVLLRGNRAYLLLTTGRFAQAIGAGVGTFAVPLLAFELTGSVAQAGLISGIGQVGALVAGLAGTLSGWHLAAVLFGSSMVSAFVNPASGCSWGRSGDCSTAWPTCCRSWPPWSGTRSRR